MNLDVDFWDSISGHKTLRHEGCEQISPRPTIWFAVGGGTQQVFELPLSQFATKRDHLAEMLVCRGLVALSASDELYLH